MTALLAAVIGCWIEWGGGGRIDDHASTLCQHLSDFVFHAEEYAALIDRNHPFPGIFFDLVYPGGWASNASIVEGNVESAEVVDGFARPSSAPIGCHSHRLEQKPHARPGFNGADRRRSRFPVKLRDYDLIAPAAAKATAVARPMPTPPPVTNATDPVSHREPALNSPRF
jgi:hypothetical protein